MPIGWNPSTWVHRQEGICAHQVQTAVAARPSETPDQLDCIV